jgi:hypothetical protein
MGQGMYLMACRTLSWHRTEPHGPLPSAFALDSTKFAALSLNLLVIV